jgi:hypothetical protein
MIKIKMKAKPESPLDLGERNTIIEHVLTTHERMV